jgi:triacylglycerol lipase
MTGQKPNDNATRAPTEHRESPLPLPSSPSCLRASVPACLSPIILHHGFGGFGNFQVGPVKVAYFSGIDAALREMNHPVILTRVHPTAGIETRARQLKEQILRQLDLIGAAHEKVLLIGHSMGGLDARYMISKLAMAERVAALLTITTPHRGTPYADWCMQHLGKRLGGVGLMNFLRLDVQAIHDLTTLSCKRFNEDVIDSPSVKYFSVSAARPWRLVPPFAMHAHKIIYEAEGDNDSLVSVKSSIWGTHLGIWPADHWHTINRRFVLELKEPTGDISPYYVRAVRQVMRAITDAGQ